MPLFGDWYGVKKEIGKLFCGIGGVKREMSKIFTGIGGVKREIFGSSGLYIELVNKMPSQFARRNGIGFTKYDFPDPYVTYTYDGQYPFEPGLYTAMYMEADAYSRYVVELDGTQIATGLMHTGSDSLTYMITKSSRITFEYLSSNVQVTIETL